MATRKTEDLPARLQSTRRRFERWRQTRRRGMRIPEPLWNAAVKMVPLYGMHRTTSALGVDYYSLQRRLEENEAASPSVSKPQEDDSTPTFLELAPAEIGRSECIVELENPSGAKMRVHLKGVAPDLAALSRGFWGLES